MEKLIHAIYLSQAAPDFSEHDTLQLLRQSRTANRKHDVSGLMLYVGGHFLQVLEGAPSMVDVVSSTLFRDKRLMQCILREPIVEREFPEWTMGFEALELNEAANILGEPLTQDPISQSLKVDPVNAKTLLSIIGRRRWQADRSGMFWAIRRSASI
jgi:hypothetical protein